MLVGVAVALPCVLGPWLLHGRRGSCWVPINLWVATVGFWGNYCGTHYFYNVLQARYTVPTGPFVLNGVPLVMYLMTHAYFCSYYTLSFWLMRRLGYGALSVPGKGALVVAMSYTTALLETWSISAFPHYTYPDFSKMLTIGSM